MSPITISSIINNLFILLSIIIIFIEDAHAETIMLAENDESPAVPIQLQRQFSNNPDIATYRQSVLLVN